MERLQKVIANNGYCSRRKAEELILAGKVSVNGVVVTTLQNDSMKIDVYVIMRHCGVSATAVAESIRQSVKYSVERFSGMLVRDVVVHIVDVRI